MEGGIGFGLAALYGEITLETARSSSRNFHDYRVLRIDEMPEVEVHIVPSTGSADRRRRARRAADRAGGGQRGLRRHRPAGEEPALHPRSKRLRPIEHSVFRRPSPYSGERASEVSSKRRNRRL